MVANPIDAPPKAGIGIFTYNQADFIRQAIDSVLAQRTDLQGEIRVHDDCSTDGTRKFVESYVVAHPGHVRAILVRQIFGGTASNVRHCVVGAAVKCTVVKQM